MDQKRRDAAHKVIATARRDRTSSAAVEYGLLTGMIAAAIYLVGSPMSHALMDQFERVATALRQATG